jgi:5-methylcytosine-specific restriction protein A
VGTYYEPNKVRLLVGNLIVFTIERGCVWLALDKQFLEASEKDKQFLEELNGWRWDEDDYPIYSQVPSRNGYYIPSENHLEIWSVIRPLHFEFIRKVAAKYRRLKKTSQAKHSSVLLSYLRNELGQFVPDPIYEQVEEWDNFALPEEVLDDVSFYEGSKQRITVNAYERNPEARKACIAYYGTRCQACELDFGEKYGEAGKGFIHVHHLKPLSNVGEEYEIDPIQDLVPVCPNCHAIIHKRNPPYTIEEVKGFLNLASGKSSRLSSLS